MPGTSKRRKTSPNPDLNPNIIPKLDPNTWVHHIIPLFGIPDREKKISILSKEFHGYNELVWENNISAFFGCKIQYSAAKKNLYKKVISSGYKSEEKFLFGKSALPIVISQKSNSNLYESIKEVFRFAMLGDIIGIKKQYDKVKDEPQFQEMSSISKGVIRIGIHFFEFLTEVYDSASNTPYSWLCYFDHQDAFNSLFPIIQKEMEVKEDSEDYSFFAVFCNQLDRLIEWWNIEKEKSTEDEDGLLKVKDNLMHAITYRRFKIAEYLFNSEVNIDIFLFQSRDANDRTFLHIAAAKGDLELVQFLVNFTPDVTAIDKSGKTALDFAKQGFDSSSDSSIKKKYKAIIDCIEQEIFEENSEKDSMKYETFEEEEKEEFSYQPII